MGRPRRQLQATAEETSTPPTELQDGQAIARVKSAEGKNLYTVELASQGDANADTLLVELPARFRSAIWIKRGGYVVIDRAAFDARHNKLGGEIVNIVRDEKQWRKESYWCVSHILYSLHHIDFGKAGRLCEESIVY